MIENALVNPLAVIRGNSQRWRFRMILGLFRFTWIRGGLWPRARDVNDYIAALEKAIALVDADLKARGIVPPSKSWKVSVETISHQQKETE